MVTYNLVITNQGMITADNIEVVDFIPSGMTLVGPADFTFDAATGTASATFMAGDANGVIPTGGLLPGTSATATIQLMVTAPVAAGTSLRNVAEIGDATDEAGNPQEDVDSAPADPNNPDSIEDADDNVIGEDGTNGGDEDESDFETVTVNRFDLALRKVLSAGQSMTVEPGDDVSFDILITNQGDIAADNIEIADFIPTGMTFNPALNADWTEVGGVATTTLTIADGDLAAGGLQPTQSATVTIILTLAAPQTAGMSLRNVAEIRDATDDNGVVQIDDDSDYNVDGDDPDMIADTDNDDIDGDGQNGGDEDESDFETVVIEVFDLALQKQLAPGQSAMVNPGDVVSYSLIITNQGMITADNIEVVDFIPSGMTFVGPADFTFDGGTNTASATFVAGDANGVIPTGGLLPGMSATATIQLMVTAPVAAGTSLRNIAEIGNATDEAGNPQVDDDSTPADPNNPDAIDENDNNVIGEDGTNGGDEDESDFETVTVNRFDLALAKVLSAGQSMTVEPGDDVSFDIVITNQGDIAADNIEIADFIPTGMTFNPALNPTWTLNGSVATTTLTVAGGLQPTMSATATIVLTLASPQVAGMSLRNVAEIRNATDDNGVEQIDDDSDYNVDGDDPDMIADTDNDNIDGDGQNGGDEDESDFETVVIEVFDLALQKQLAPGQSAMVNPGDVVTYNLVITNQGMITADNIEVVDFIPSGMTFVGPADFTFDGGTNTASATFVAGAANGVIPVGGLLPGTSATATIQLMVTAPVAAGTSLRNIAELGDATDEAGNPQVDDDSTPADPNNPDAIDENDNNVIGEDGTNGGDEDESDFETVTVNRFDLALAKVLSAGQEMAVQPGDTVSFDIVITNQGDIAADNIEIADFIPSGMIFDASLNPDWTEAGGVATTTLIIAGGLQPTQSTFVTIMLKLASPQTAGMSLRNVAEIRNATDDNGVEQIDDDSDYNVDGDDPDMIADTDNDNIDGDGQNGGDEDESDFETVTIQVFDLALAKVLAPGQSSSVLAGDTVTFRINIYNQGDIAADSIGIVDYVFNGMFGFLPFDPTIPGNEGWTVGSSSNDTTLVSALLTVADGDIPAGGFVPGTGPLFKDIFLVISPQMEPTMTITNVAEITGATDENGNPQEDVDSQPDSLQNDNFLVDNDINGNSNTGGDEDDSDEETLTIGAFDLALSKRLAPGQSLVVSPGDNVSFVIEVINQGAIAADSILITDYVPAGFLFDPALNPDWTINANGDPQLLLVRGDGLGSVDGLESGESQEVIIVLTVAGPELPDFATGDPIDPAGVLPGDTLVNLAEITFATDTSGTIRQDIDSTPDDIADNDGDIDDDEVNGDSNLGEDEDDSDIALVIVECYADPGFDNTIQVCLGCDEAEVVINLFESLGGLPNLGGFFTVLAPGFIDEDGNPIVVDISDPTNVIIPGTLDRSRDFRIRYTIPAINACPARSAIITIDIFDIQNLPCEGFTNISLGEDCEAIITPDLILSGNLTCANSLTVVLITQAGDTIPNATVNNDHIGMELFVNLVDEQCDNNCWGTLLVEDKKKPIIDCPDDADSFDGIDFICTDLDLILGVPGSVTKTGSPIFTDNCAPIADLDLIFNDVLLPTSDPQCNPRTILRTFTVTDPSGNFNRCTQEITVRPATLADVTFDSDAVEISCGTTFETLPNGNPTTAVTGEPFVTTACSIQPLVGNGSYCSIGNNFVDGPRTTTCANTYKFFRTWTIFDWCDPDGDQITYTQLIKVGDFEAPTVVAPTQDLNFDGVADDGLFFTTNALNCEALFIVPAPVVSDNCSATFNVVANIYPGQDTTATPIGSFLPGQLTSNIPSGLHTLRYTATDACGNVTNVDVDLLIDDATDPVAKCENGLNISLGGSADNMGMAILTALDVDQNSYDECSNVTLAIACIDSLTDELIDPVLGYQPSITLGCDDLGTKRISLRATDAAGNVNYCWLDVLVEDKNAPLCIPPSAMTVLCSDIPFDFPANVGTAFGLDAANVGALLNDLFGTANGLDNCPGATVEDLTPIDLRDNCGIGTVTRRFQITDVQGLTAPVCQQIVTVLEQHDYTIKFPGDSDSEDCDQDPVEMIGFTERACDLIAVSVHPDTFQATADECYKIRNTIEVINWCEYDGIADPITLPRDADGDTNLTEDFWLHVVPSTNLGSITDDRAFLDRDGNPDNGVPSFIGDLSSFPTTQVTTYGTDARRGYFRYVQFVKVYDAVAPTIDTTGNQSDFCSFDGALCAGDVDLTFTVDDACSPNAITVVSVTVDPFVVDANNDGIITAVEFQAGSLPTTASIATNFAGNVLTIDADNIPIGRHAIRVEILDGCGNRAAVIYVINVLDCKAPTPICINGLTATLMPDGNGGGMAAIWVSDFVASGTDDCTPEVKFTLYRSADANVDGFFTNPLDTGLILTCDDLGLLPVRVYTTDGANQEDFCETTLSVQANDATVCTGSGVAGIAGTIATFTNLTVENVEVNLSGTTTAVATTDANGTYQFTGISAGGDYTVTPGRDGDDINGVTTLDIVIISKHILGIQELDNPYRLIAADVNRSTSITTIDLVQIRRLILGLDEEFTQNTSWRFVDTSHEFAVPTNPWSAAFPEISNYNNVTAGIADADFVAVKVGDVNGTSVANAWQPAQERTFRGDLQFWMNQTDLKAGETYEIPVYASNLDEVQGYQATLEFDRQSVEIALIEPGLISEANFGWRFAEQGLVTTSWNWPNGRIPADLNGDEVLFTLVLNAKVDTELSEVVAAGSRYTFAEAYGLATGDLMNIALAFQLPEMQVEGYVLYQNIPNPFRKATLIGFDLPAPARVTVRISDLEGRTVRILTQDGAAGYNSLRLTRRQLGGSTGTYFYTVSTGDWQASKRMIMVD